MQMRTRRMLAAFGAVLALGLPLGACSDDDGDGNPEVNVPEDVDVDVQQGDDKKGD